MRAALAGEGGLEDEAALMRARMLDIEPQFSTTTFVRWQGLKDQAYRQRLHQALTASGFPE